MDFAPTIVVKSIVNINAKTKILLFILFSFYLKMVDNKPINNQTPVAASNVNVNLKQMQIA